MELRAMFVRSCIVCLIAFVVISSVEGQSLLHADEPTLTKEEELVQEDVRQNYKALYGNDLDTVLKFTHSKVIELLGGQAKAREALAVGLKSVSAIKLDELTFPERPIFLKGTENEFVIVPTKSQLRASGRKVESFNFLFGARKIGDKDWAYIEGSRLNPTSVLQFFPDFPKGYTFPKTSRKLID
jgi:hypothetical protein